MEEKAAKALAYMEKNWGEPSVIVQQSDYSKAIFSRTMISEGKYYWKGKTPVSTKPIITNDNFSEDAQSSNDSVPNASSDDEGNSHFGRGERWQGNLTM